MRIGNREFETGKHTYIQGILNVTPDSFSDGGQYTDVDKALRHALDMIGEGADIIDIGGESTRPGYTKIPSEIQIERVIPVITRIKSESDVPISIDTTEIDVAKAAIEAGADIVNDVSAMESDERMAALVASSGVCCILMHNGRNTEYSDFKEEFFKRVNTFTQKAIAKGVAKDKIIVDPGVGFGKTTAENLLLIDLIDQIRDIGFPVLLGASRKSFIGEILGTDVGERLEGTLATTAVAVMKGASFVRVHDVKENARIIKMTEAIKNGCN